MISRREFLLALGAGALAASLPALAQQPRIVRIGLIDSGPPSPGWREALVSGLRELGYVEGKNLVIEQRWAEAGRYERLPGLAAEMVGTKVDVLVAGGNQAIRAVQQATPVIPIVMVRTADPVGSGSIASLARPGRNITGLTNVNADLGAKYLELQRAMVPKLSRVGVLMNRSNAGHADRVSLVLASGKKSGVSVSPAQASTAAEIEAAFGTMKRLTVPPDLLLRADKVI